MSEAANSEQENSVLSPPAGFKLRCTLPGHSDIITQLAWSADGKKLATASQDRTIRIWNTEAGELVSTLEGHTDIILGITWSPDGKTLASTSADNTIRLWDIQSGQQRSVIENESSNAIAWSPSGEMFVSKGKYKDRGINYWDDKNQKLIKDLGSRFGIIY